MKKWLIAVFILLPLAHLPAQNYRYADYDGFFGPLHNNNFPSAWLRSNEYIPEEATKNFFVNWDYETSPFLLESGERSSFSLKFNLKSPASGYHAVFMLPLGREVDLSKGLRVDLRFVSSRSTTVGGVLQFFTVKNENINFLELHRFGFSDSTWRREYFNRWRDSTLAKTDTLYMYFWGDEIGVDVAKTYFLDNFCVWNETLNVWVPLGTLGERVGGEVKILDYEPKIFSDTLEFEKTYLDKPFSILGVKNTSISPHRFEWRLNGAIISDRNTATVRFEERGKNYRLTGIVSAPPALSRDTLEYNYFVSSGSLKIIDFSPLVLKDTVLVNSQGKFTVKAVTNTTGKPVSYYWTDNGVPVGYEDSVAFNFKTSGDHQIKVLASAGSSVVSLTWFYYVDPGFLKISGFSPLALKDTLLIMTEETFLISSVLNTTAYPVQYRFTDNGEAVSRENFAKVVFAKTGKHRIVGYAENATAIDSVVWHREIDPGTIKIIGNTPSSLRDTFLIGSQVSFELKYSNTTARAPSFYWTVDGVFAGAQNPIAVSFKEARQYRIVGRVFNEVGNDSLAWVIEIDHGSIRIARFSPVSLRDTVNSDSRIVFRVDSVFNTTLLPLKFRWSYNGAVVGESDSLIAIFRNPGEHKIVAHVSNNVSSDSVIWFEFVKSPITAVSTESQVPAAFTLYQNYPNPFNPRTMIKFSLAGTGPVRLSIYDALGREVKVLVDEVKAAGVYTVNFDGSALPSGIYLYRLTAHGFVETKKLCLLK